MSREICNHDKCTGCTACKDICPKQCITMQPDDLDALYPVVDESICINCGLCDKTCPNNRELSYRLPHKVWAAWSNDNDVRRTSASGGIACELYRYWIKNGGVATGVVYDRDKGCHFILLENESDIKAVQNSKYTFSDTAEIYKIVKQKLQVGIPVLFIGVPCQVAGLYGFLKQEYDNLTTVDIICHGMPPATYLEQHIKNIENKRKEYTRKLFFRDPKYYTYTFTFTLKNNAGKEFYKKKVLTRDNYQLGYHRALIYRENCYSCNYARKERISDLTIGDFSGLGSIAPVNYDTRNVSCILQNTQKGESLLLNLGTAISMQERPAREAFDFEKQLKAPSIKHNCRMVFETEYRLHKNYEKAANFALKEEKRKAVKQKATLRCKELIKCFIPISIIKSIKRLLGK